jgi:hypothetical protein
LVDRANRFAIGTAIVATNKNLMIEIGVAAPHHACIGNSLSGGSSEIRRDRSKIRADRCRHRRQD